MNLGNRKSGKLKKLVMLLGIVLSIGCIMYAVDNDYDGLDDADEEYRLNLYAPKLIFHPDEKGRPRSVESLFDEEQKENTR